MEDSSKNSLLPVSDPAATSRGGKKSPTMTKKGVCAAISYTACAVLLVIFNKAALSSYNFPCVNVITLFQGYFIFFLTKWLGFLLLQTLHHFLSII